MEPHDFFDDPAFIPKNCETHHQLLSASIWLAKVRRHLRSHESALKSTPRLAPAIGASRTMANCLGPAQALSRGTHFKAWKTNCERDRTPILRLSAIKRNPHYMTLGFLEILAQLTT